jgi:hypothetical protein
MILVLALIMVLAGWPLVGRVSELRVARYTAGPQEVEAVRAAFGTWHTVSLLLNLLTVLLVTVAMALAAWLPPPAPSKSATDV